MNPAVGQARADAAERDCHCKPGNAHRAIAGAEFRCKCGRRWRVTKNHLWDGRVCGCGWKRVA